jgi:hypothetical protein
MGTVLFWSPCSISIGLHYLCSELLVSLQGLYITLERSTGYRYHAGSSRSSPHAGMPKSIKDTSYPVKQSKDCHPTRLLFLFYSRNQDIFRVRLALGRAMSQAVSCRPLTAEVRVRPRFNPCGICSGQSVTETGFSLKFFGFSPVNAIHSIVALQVISSRG